MNYLKGRWQQAKVERAFFTVRAACVSGRSFMDTPAVFPRTFTVWFSLSRESDANQQIKEKRFDKTGVKHHHESCLACEKGSCTDGLFFFFFFLTHTVNM